MSKKVNMSVLFVFYCILIVYFQQIAIMPSNNDTQPTTASEYQNTTTNNNNNTFTKRGSWFQEFLSRTPSPTGSHSKYEFEKEEMENDQIQGNHLRPKDKRLSQLQKTSSFPSTTEQPNQDGYECEGPVGMRKRAATESEMGKSSFHKILILCPIQHHTHHSMMFVPSLPFN